MEKLINIGVTLGDVFHADLLRVRIDISGQHQERDECTREYNRLLTQVREALVGVGIPAEDIKNSEYRVSAHKKTLYIKEDDRYYRAASELDGYEYSADVSLKRAADPEEAKAIWIALCSCDDGVQFRFSYDIKDEEFVKTTLLSDAIAESKRRAEILADAAGAKVTGIQSISYQYDNNAYGVAAAYAPSAPSAAYGGSYNDAPEFNPKDIYVECVVEAQWAMEA